MGFSKTEIKNKKMNLDHLNKCYQFFKAKALEKGYDETNDTAFIQELLKEYIKDFNELIDTDALSNNELYQFDNVDDVSTQNEIKPDKYGIDCLF